MEIINSDEAGYPSPPKRGNISHKAPNYGPAKRRGNKLFRCDTCKYCRRRYSGIFGFDCAHPDHPEQCSSKYGCDDWKRKRQCSGKAKIKAAIDSFFRKLHCWM